MFFVIEVKTFDDKYLYVFIICIVLKSRAVKVIDFQINLKYIKKVIGFEFGLWFRFEFDIEKRKFML